MKPKPVTHFSNYVPSPALGPDKTHIDIAVYYSKGGINYFNYKTDARGFYASFNPVKREVTAYGTSTSFMMFNNDGMKFLLEPAIKFNAKKLATWVATVNAKANDVAALLNAGDRSGAIALMRSLSLVYAPAPTPTVSDAVTA